MYVGTAFHSKEVNQTTATSTENTHLESGRTELRTFKAAQHEPSGYTRRADLQTLLKRRGCMQRSGPTAAPSLTFARVDAGESAIIFGRR